MMPISASSFMVVSGDTQPSSEGPISKPASNSPITEGMPKRATVSDSRRAEIRMMASKRKN